MNKAEHRQEVGVLSNVLIPASMEAKAMNRLQLQETERRYQETLRRTQGERDQALIERCQAIAEAHDLHGSTYEQIADELGLHHSRVIRLAARHRQGR
jgi:DNA-directed RNA polymerase specialized sigma24 family protein